MRSVHTALKVYFVNIALTSCIACLFIVIIENRTYANVLSEVEGSSNSTFSNRVVNADSSFVEITIAASNTTGIFGTLTLRHRFLMLANNMDSSNSPRDPGQNDSGEELVVPISNNRQKLILAEPVNTDQAGISGADSLPSTEQDSVLLLDENTKNNIQPEVAASADIDNQIILPPPPKPQEAPSIPVLPEVKQEKLVEATVAEVPPKMPVSSTSSPPPAEVQPVVESPTQQISEVAAPAVMPKIPKIYIVKRGDTLGKISAQLLQDVNLTTSQKLLALFRGNPSAFYSNNMHYLLRGSEIKISDELNKFVVESDAESRKIVLEQYSQFSKPADSLRIEKGEVKVRVPESSSATSAQIDDIQTIPKAASSQEVIVVPDTVPAEPSPAGIPVQPSLTDSAQNEQNIASSILEASNFEDLPVEKKSNKSITIALIAMIFAALGGYVFFRIKNKSREYIE